jgi:arginine decarboxylase
MIELNLVTLVEQACEVDPEQVLTPSDTYQKLLRNGTEKVKFTEMAGRVAGVMLVPYPPGIPLSMPGERLGTIDSPVMRLILAFEEFGKRFPGFEREVHGIEVDANGDYWMRSVNETNEAANGMKKNGKHKPPSSAPPLKRKKKTTVVPGQVHPPENPNGNPV